MLLLDCERLIAKSNFYKYDFKEWSLNKIV